MLSQLWMADPANAEADGDDENAEADGDDENWTEMDDEEMIVWANRAVHQGLIKPYHGDTIHWISSDRYRNEGLMFWSETNGFMFPWTEIDDYGSVPPHFRVGEHGFRPDHWADRVDHNSIVFLSDAIVSTLENKRLENAKTKSTDVDIEFYTNIEIYGRTYRVGVDHDKPVGIAYHNMGDMTLIPCDC